MERKKILIQLTQNIEKLAPSRIITLLGGFWICLNLISYLLILIRIFYLPNAPSLSQHWSFYYNDKPWTPNNLEVNPIIGNHYFGDFQLGLIYSSLDNPYEGNQLLPYGYPPLIHQILKHFAQFDLQYIFAGFVLLQISLIYFFIVLVSKNMKPSSRKIFQFISIVVCGFSIPLAVGLDRGNFVVLTVTLSAIALYLSLNSDSKPNREHLVAALLFSVAINLKAYVLVLVFILFLLQRKRIASLTIIFTILPNLILAFLYPGGPFRVIKVYITSLLFYSDNPDPYFSLSGISQIAGIGRALQIIFNINPHSFILFSNRYSLYLGLFWLAATFLLVYQIKMPIFLKIIFILSNLQFFAPVSMFYTGIWNMFALILIFQNLMARIEDKKFSSNGDWNLYIILLGVGAIVSLLPNPTRFYFILPSISWMIIIYGLAIKNLMNLRLNFKEEK